MILTWRNKLRRISRMDWAEIRTRLGQELHKRNDVLRYRLGMAEQPVRMNESGKCSGAFFFAAGEAQQRAQLLRQHLPDQANKIVSEADEVCQHRFRLLGYENLDYGAEIDWHLDRVHGKRAPLDPWARIAFLDFGVVGDHKITWELNRHQHLVTLAKAWLLTQDDRYVGELVSQWHSWKKSNPYPLGINWASTLEVAFRSLSWIWIDHLLASSHEFAELRSELIPALAFHGCYIERYLSTYFSPNTHLLGEAVAMFFLGTLYPQMPRAARWRERGWKIVVHEAGRQVRTDGVYFEQSLHYHVYALDFFIYARLLASANDMPVPAAYDGVLLGMLEVVNALAQAGPSEGFGDDDGGRLFDPRRNRTEHMTDPLAIGAVTYNRDDLTAQLTEESIWLFGNRAVAELAASRAPSHPHSIAFPDGGLYVLADSQPAPQTIMIDAGPQGVGRCGHGHADALSLRWTFNGTRLLVDSGSGVYISSDPADRNLLRGTAAHNSLLVDGLDQAVPDGPFAWKDIPMTTVERWIIGKTFTYFAGSHNGYERMADPVTHRRCVLRVNGRIWLVRDVALGGGQHDLEVRWHFASDCTLDETKKEGARLVSTKASPHPTVRMLTPEVTSWRTHIRSGLISPSYGCYQPAPEMRCEARATLPAEIATAFLAANEVKKEMDPVRMVGTKDLSVQIYELLDDGGQDHVFFFALNAQSWSRGPWSSDAELLYCQIEREQLTQLVVIGASSLTWQGHSLFNTCDSIKFFEWRRQGSVTHSEPLSVATIRSLDDLRDVFSPTRSSSPSLAERR